MRPIDADELMEKYHKTPVWDSWVEINNAPTIDAVPVVRCKDCKHSFERSERKTKRTPEEKFLRRPFCFLRGPAAWRGEIDFFLSGIAKRFLFSSVW